MNAVQLYDHLKRWEYPHDKELIRDIVARLHPCDATEPLWRFLTSITVGHITLRPSGDVSPEERALANVQRADGTLPQWFQPDYELTTPHDTEGSEFRATRLAEKIVDATRLGIKRSQNARVGLADITRQRQKVKRATDELCKLMDQSPALARIRLGDVFNGPGNAPPKEFRPIAVRQHKLRDAIEAFGECLFDEKGKPCRLPGDLEFVGSGAAGNREASCIEDCLAEVLIKNSETSRPWPIITCIVNAMLGTDYDAKNRCRGYNKRMATRGE